MPTILAGMQVYMEDNNCFSISQFYDKFFSICIFSNYLRMLSLEVLSVLQNYLPQQAKLPSREVTSPKEAINNLARLEATVAAYFTEKNDMYEEYIGAANELRGA